MRTRRCLAYVAAYLILSGLALAIAPEASLRLMFATGDYGPVMPRWVGMMSLALGTVITQAVRRQLSVLYPLGFFMPAAMMPGLYGLYVLSDDPLFLTLLAVVGVGVLMTGASLIVDRIKRAPLDRDNRASSHARR